jgi:hypothetical protein
MATSPEETWSQFREHIALHAGSYASGKFAAHPKKSTECQRCSMSDLCGWRRLSETQEGGPAHE